MNIRNNLKNFLFDKDYFISLYENKIHIYGFKKVLRLSKNMFSLEFENFILNIKGDKITVKKMLSSELLLSGLINNFSIDYYE